MLSGRFVAATTIPFRHLSTTKTNRGRAKLPPLLYFPTKWTKIKPLNQKRSHVTEHVFHPTPFPLNLKKSSDFLISNMGGNTHLPLLLTWGNKCQNPQKIVDRGSWKETKPLRTHCGQTPNPGFTSPQVSLPFLRICGQPLTHENTKHPSFHRKVVQKKNNNLPLYYHDSICPEISVENKKLVKNSPKSFKRDWNRKLSELIKTPCAATPFFLQTQRNNRNLFQ